MRWVSWYNRLQDHIEVEDGMTIVEHNGSENNANREEQESRSQNSATEKLTARSPRASADHCNRDAEADYRECAPAPGMDNEGMGSLVQAAHSDDLSGAMSSAHCETGAHRGRT